MKAFVFPGQGSQFVGMGKALYDTYPLAQELFARADAILGFPISEIMFAGSDEALTQTRVTQPAVFIHSVIAALTQSSADEIAMVAGHSLGEFSALVVGGALTFDDGLRLVAARASAMQKACDAAAGTMAAIIALPDSTIEEVCHALQEEGHTVVAANYNCPGQLVISGTKEAITLACERLTAAGAKRALPLKVGGAFHSPLMQPAKEELQEAIERTTFLTPRCAIYQNVDGQAHDEPAEIKANLIAQLTAPVLWTKEVQQMIAAGATTFVECGPGKALQGMIAKIAKGNDAISITALS